MKKYITIAAAVVFVSMGATPASMPCGAGEIGVLCCCTNMFGQVCCAEQSLCAGAVPGCVCV